MRMPDAIKNSLAEIAVGLSVVAFAGMGTLLINTGRALEDFEHHLQLAQHNGQLIQNKAVERSVGEVDLKVEKLGEKVEAIDEKIEKQVEESAAFRTEQRAATANIIRSLGRIEGATGNGGD